MLCKKDGAQNLASLPGADFWEKQEAEVKIEEQEIRMLEAEGGPEYQDYKVPVHETLSYALKMANKEMPTKREEKVIEPVYFEPSNPAFKLVKRRQLTADLLHGIGVPRKFTAFFDRMMIKDEENHQFAENEGNHEVWKKWRCDPRIGEGLLHLYGDQAYLLYKLRFALEQLNICPPS